MRAHTHTHTHTRTHADYKTSLKADLVGEEREVVLRGCHQRGADRLLQLCFANGGVYTKLGQHLGQLVGGLGQGTKIMHTYVFG